MGEFYHSPHLSHHKNNNQRKIMTTEQQLLANQKNALVSTGPKSPKGKAVVATNAVKHGIFTKDLFISTGSCQVEKEEYFELLNNLLNCLSPQNQMESLLVEKITIDFWRLRRALKFEIGSMKQRLEEIYKEFYSYDRKSNPEIEKEINYLESTIKWIDAYIGCLQRGDVDCDQPKWEGRAIESDIVEDFYLISKTLNILSYEEREQLILESNFVKLRAILEQNGYTSRETISGKLVEIYTCQRQRYEKEIIELRQNRAANVEADKLNNMLGSLPNHENTDKVLKYERSLQKSIFQNLFLLKKLQGSF